MEPIKDEEPVYRCPEEWERPKGLCPHQCDLDEGHDGKHERED